MKGITTSNDIHVFYLEEYYIKELLIELTNTDIPKEPAIRELIYQLKQILEND